MGRSSRLVIAVFSTAFFVADAFGAELSNVRVRTELMRAPVTKAVAGAAERLARPSCAQILGEFEDGSDQTLLERLEATGLDAPQYLGSILFYDGAGGDGCRRSWILAVTEPGSRVVQICPSFFRHSRHNPNLAAAIVIHEAMHTLGLGENPPSSREITARVLKACH